MWLEESIGTRINETRVSQALELDPDMVSTACPYCMIMLDDGLKAKQASGEAKEGIQVLDISQVLERSLQD